MVDLPTNLSIQIVPPFIGFVPPEAHFIHQDRKRHQDICGDGIVTVLHRTGWTGREEPWTTACATEMETGRMVAVGWCRPIKWQDRPGLNLAYAVDADYCGRGLAGVTASLAYLHAVLGNGQELDADVNIQCNATNAPAIAVAASMGFEAHAAANFTVPILKRTYVGFQMRGPLMYERASNLLMLRTGTSEAEQKAHLPTHPHP